jgi:hypothetical protein
MAATLLSNMIIPQLFNDYIVERTAQLSRLRQSGIIADMSELLGDKLGGTTVNMPFFKDLTGTDDVVADTADLAINNITTSQDVAAKLYRAKVFGASDLSGDLAGTDPMAAIANLFAEWWVRQEQTTLLKVLEGAMGCAWLVRRRTSMPTRSSMPLPSSETLRTRWLASWFTRIPTA